MKKVALHSQYTLIVHALAIRIGQKWQRTHIHKTNSYTQLGEAAYALMGLISYITYSKARVKPTK
jgi:hypothetical protein